MSGAMAGSRACFEELVGWLEGAEAADLDHAALEEQLDRRGRELLRQLLQGTLDLRALREARLDRVTDVHGTRHGSVEPGHMRALGSIFGTVNITRRAYRHRGHPNLYPVDGSLNLPRALHSHRIRRLAAAEATRGSFDEATQAISRATGQQLGKRQVESLTATAAVDVDLVPAHRRPPQSRRLYGYADG